LGCNARKKKSIIIIITVIWPNTRSDGVQISRFPSFNYLLFHPTDIFDSNVQELPSRRMRSIYFRYITRLTLKKKTFLPSWLAASFINCLTLRIRYIHLPCEKLTKSQNDSRCWEWPSDGTGSVCHSKYTASVEHYAGWWHCLFMLLPLFTRSDFLDIGNVKYLPTLILCHIFLWGTTLLFICCFCNDATCSSDYI